MNVIAYKTHKIQPNENLYKILDRYLPKLEEKSVVVIASKIVGICDGRVVKIQETDQKETQKNKLAKQETEYYLPKKFNQYGFLITINNNVMVASGGVDESNSDGFFSLWPEDPQKRANEIRDYLIKKHHMQNIGVILTDSKLTPLRWGVTGIAIAHSGFRALNSYIGKPDIYGNLMHAEQSNVADSLAVAAVAEMGEGDEQQPLAVVTNVNFVNFQQRNPTEEELKALKIDLQDDVYASLLTSVQWKKGGRFNA